MTSAPPTTAERQTAAATARPKARVVVTQHRLLHYRQTFFDRLRGACAARGIVTQRALAECNNCCMHK